MCIALPNLFLATTLKLHAEAVSLGMYCYLVEKVRQSALKPKDPKQITFITGLLLLIFATLSL